MDSKKSNTYGKDRPRLTVPNRGTHAPPRRSNTVVQPTVSPTGPNQVGKTGSRPKSRRPGVTKATRIRKLLSSKRNIVILVGLLIIMTVAWTTIRQKITTDTDTPGNMSSAGNPEYQTILPGEKSITELGGWKRISPPQNDPVYAYVDTIDQVNVTVSQQPLPKSFEGNIDNQTAELAKKFNATKKINAGDTSMYVGTSAKGPQSAILAKGSLLILIKSQTKIEDASWAAYAKSLN